MAGLLILIRKEDLLPRALEMGKTTRMGTTNTTLFTNQKQIDRAIKAAVDQYERCKRSLQKVGKRKKQRSQSRMVRGRKEV